MTRRRTWTVQLVAPHEPPRKGWRKVGSAGRHRDQHAVLIQKTRKKRGKR